jgi:hypothetical protein
MNTDTPKELNIRISDYDNRWNKVAAELAKGHLTASRAPASHDQQRQKTEPVVAVPSDEKRRDS